MKFWCLFSGLAALTVILSACPDDATSEADPVVADVPAATDLVAPDTQVPDLVEAPDVVSLPDVQVVAALDVNEDAMVVDVPDVPDVPDHEPDIEPELGVDAAPDVIVEPDLPPSPPTCPDSDPMNNTTLLIAPYLQAATPTGLWVMWETDEGVESRVEYGPTPEMGHAVCGGARDGAFSWIHEVELAGLQPATRYYYRVLTDSFVGETHHFITPPEKTSEASFRMIAFADSQRASAAPDKLEEVVNDGVLGYSEQHLGSDIAEEIAMVMFAGDLVDNGWLYDQWRDELFAPSAELFSHVPVYPVLGNHEANSPFYFWLFHLPENGTPKYEEHWYWVDYSNVRVIGLDSNTGYRVDAQLQWLEDVLVDACQDPTIDFVFAQLHHPHLSELWTPGEIDYTGDVVARLEDFSTECDKPSAHFFGHTHGYSRGQSRDHQHLWVNVASAGGAIDYWGEHAQADYDEFTVSQDEWGFTLVDVAAGEDPSFVLRRISRGDDAVVRENDVTDQVLIRRYNQPPTKPLAVAPFGALGDCGGGVTLVASPYEDPDGDLHGASQWQVGQSCDGFSTPVFDRWVQHENWYNAVDTQAGDDLEDIVFTGAAVGAPYCWRVRYRDRSLRWSAWSEPVPFELGGAGGGATENLLVNPGAEDGTSDWTATAGQLESLEGGQCNGTDPHTGQRYFAVGGLCDASSYGEAFQRVMVPMDLVADVDAGAVMASYGAWLSDYAGDDVPAVHLVFRGGDDEQLGVAPTLAGPLSSWQQYIGSASVPGGTRAIDFVMSGTRNAGSDNDSYVDDAWLRLARCGSP